MSEVNLFPAISLNLIIVLVENFKLVSLKYSIYFVAFAHLINYVQVGSIALNLIILIVVALSNC